MNQARGILLYCCTYELSTAVHMDEFRHDFHPSNSINTNYYYIYFFCATVGATLCLHFLSISMLNEIYASMASAFSNF